MKNRLTVLTIALLAGAAAAATQAPSANFDGPEQKDDAAPGLAESFHKVKTTDVEGQHPQNIADADGQVLQVTRDLIRFKTVATQGKIPTDLPEFVALRAYLKNLAKRLGLDYKTYQNEQIMEFAAGTGAQTLAFWTHADVVPAGTGWDPGIDPWAATIKDGKLYGRGSLDDKSPAACILFDMKRMKEEGLIPSGKRIVLVISSSEETDDWEAVKAFSAEKRYKWNLVADGKFPAGIAEKGLLDGYLSLPIDANDASDSREHAYKIVSVRSGEAINQLSSRAEATLVSSSTPAQLRALADQFVAVHPAAKIEVAPEADRLKVTTAGKSSHAAYPDNGHNATTDMVEFLLSLDLEPNAYAVLLKGVHAAFGTVTDGSTIGINVPEDAQYTPRGSTMVNSILTRENAAQGVDKKEVLRASFDIRFHHKFTAQQVLDALTAKVRGVDRRFEVDTETKLAPFFNDPNSPFVKLLVRIHNEEAKKDLPPLSVGGASQARILTGQYRVCFGPTYNGKQIHGPNEFISLESLQLNTRIYFRAMKELLSGKGE